LLKGRAGKLALKARRASGRPSGSHYQFTLLNNFAFGEIAAKRHLTG